MNIIWPTILDELPTEIPSIYFKGPVAIWLPSSVLASDEQNITIKRNSPTLNQVFKAISAFYWQEVDDEEIERVSNRDANFAHLLQSKHPIYRHQLMGDRIMFRGLSQTEEDDGYRLCLESY